MSISDERRKEIWSAVLMADITPARALFEYDLKPDVATDFNERLEYRSMDEWLDEPVMSAEDKGLRPLTSEERKWLVMEFVDALRVAHADDAERAVES